MKFNCSYYEVTLDQRDPYPAWVDLKFYSESEEFRITVRPEDFIYFVDNLISFSKYKLKDSHMKEGLWK